MDDNSDEEDEDYIDEQPIDEDEDENEDDGDKVGQVTAQDLSDYPILHPSYRDSIHNVINFMKRENGGMIYVLHYQSEFQRAVNEYKASNDPTFIDQLFDVIAVLCFDRVQVAGIMKGNSFLIYLQ